MNQPFIDRHIRLFLKLFSETNKPLDLLLSQYFRATKSLGSKDRRIMGDTIYGMIRWKSLIEFFSPADPLHFYQTIDWAEIKKDPSIPNAVKLGMPEYLYEQFCIHFGEKKADSLGEILNRSAPTTVRVNLLKTTRDDLLQKWKEKFSISPCGNMGIQFQKREPLFALPEFKEGLFELQDEGSQYIAEQVEARPGQVVLDYCSGSGGKTLAFAHRLQGKGQIYLHDVRKEALYEARKRMKRAGIQNGQIVLDPKKLRPCDWILLDVPCSGSGTIRRNPDHKWKINHEMIEHLSSLQKNIIKKSIAYLKPGGRLVYATCSLLPQENEHQVEYILKNFPLTLEKEPTLLLPKEGGMDGFFCATFKMVVLL
ncbi:MAG TPA: RsmB/NOP family class I SAM-dependent RNA methyltransferase [Chlamydiales bacterium]|nr:RsmB/NOP family class I SAM-dependent RNA methyltransferase [Chlamydiales bacterium]